MLRCFLFKPKRNYLSLLGRLPTKHLEVCRPGTAFVPLWIYSLLFLLLTSHPVATMALLSLCWSLFLAGRWGVSKGPNTKEVCMQANFEGRAWSRRQMAETSSLVEGGEQEKEGFLSSRWVCSQASGTEV